MPDEDVLEIGAWLDELEIAIRRAETALEAAEQHTNDDAIFREAKGASDELHEAYSLANYALNNLKL